MNSSLMNLALLGTDAQSSCFNGSQYEPFADVFANAEASVAKKTALAIGLEGLFDQASPSKAAENVESSISPKDDGRRDYLPLEVADAVLTILEYCFSIADLFSTTSLARYFDPAARLLETLARYGQRIPPERAATFVSLFEPENRRRVDPALIAAVAPPNVRELVRYETSLRDALWKFPLFLEPNDVPLGVTIDELERLFHDQATNIPTKASMLKALRAIAPDRARTALETLFENASRKDWGKYAKALIPCLATRLAPNDAPFLKTVLKNVKNAAACVAAADMLAELRDPEYLKSIYEYAETVFSRDLTISSPDVTKRSSLLSLGLYFGVNHKMHKFDSEKRCKLFFELFKRIPLEHWEEFFNEPPSTILDKMPGASFFYPIYYGFRASFLFHNGPRRWEEPLSRLRNDWQNAVWEARWHADALLCADFKDANAIRDAIDRFRTHKIASIPDNLLVASLFHGDYPEDSSFYAKSFQDKKAWALHYGLVRSVADKIATTLDGLLVATTLAIFEPYPWRDEFVEFYDFTLTNALNSFIEFVDEPPPKMRSVMEFPLPSRRPDCLRRIPEPSKSLLERLREQDDDVPFECRMSHITVAIGKDQWMYLWNSTSDFARAFWTCTLPVLHLFPQRLRRKYAEIGKKFYMRCILRPLFHPYDFSSNCPELKEEFPLFVFSRLYESSRFLTAAEIMEKHFFTLTRPE